MGAGIVAYGMLWIFTQSGGSGPPPTAAERRQSAALVLLGVTLAVSMAWLFNGTAAHVVGPIIVVAVGAALVWREFDAEGPRTLLGLPVRPSVSTWTRILAGATLIVVGLGVVVLGRINLSSLGSALVAVAVTLIGVGLLTVPLWLRMMRALNSERAARIRNEEREEIASHLHDSVLQTLALIQRQADDAQEVVRLARSQERELRKWLFSDAMPAESSLAAALRTIAGEVEDQHGVKVSPGHGLRPGRWHRAPPELALPARAFHRSTRRHPRGPGQCRQTRRRLPTIDLFAEVEPHQVSIFVRDRGAGFDPADVPDDRQGLSKSIHARIERRGGSVVIDSTLGRGTEVRITMPRRDSEGAQTGAGGNGVAAADAREGVDASADARHNLKTGYAQSDSVG